MNSAEAKRLDELYEELLREHVDVAIAGLTTSITNRKADLTKLITVRSNDPNIDDEKLTREAIQKELEKIQAEDAKQTELVTSLSAKTQQHENSQKTYQDKLDVITVTLALPDDEANRAARAKANAEKSIVERKQREEQAAFEKFETELNKLKDEEPDRKARKNTLEKAIADAGIQTLEATKDKEEKQKNLLESLKTELDKEKTEFEKLTDATKLDEIQKAAREKSKELEDENLKKTIENFLDQQNIHYQNKIRAFERARDIARADAQAKNRAQITCEAGAGPANNAEFDRFIKNLQRDHFFYDAKGRPLVEYVPGGNSLMGESKPALVLTDDPRSAEVAAYTARAMGWTSVTIEKGTREERDQLARYALQNEFEKISINVTDATGRPSFSGTDLIWSNIFKARANLPAREGIDKQIFSKEAKSENTRLYLQLKIDYPAEATALRSYMLSALTGEQLAKMAYDLRNDPERGEFYQFLNSLPVIKKHDIAATFLEQTKDFIFEEDSAAQFKTFLFGRLTPVESANTFLSLDDNEKRDLYAALSQQQRIAMLAELTLPQLTAAVTTLNTQLSADDLSAVVTNKQPDFARDFWEQTKTSNIYNEAQGIQLKKTVWARFSLEQLANIARSTSDDELPAFYHVFNKETRKQVVEQFDANILVKMAPAILSDKEVVREPKVRMLARFDANQLINVADKMHKASESGPKFYSMLQDAFFVKKQSIKNNLDAANFNVAVEEFLKYTKNQKTIDYDQPEAKQLAIKLLAMLPAAHLKDIFERDSNRAVQYYPLLNIEHRKELLNELNQETLAVIAKNLINNNEIGRDTKVSLLCKLSPQQLANVAKNIAENERSEFYKLLGDVFFNKKDRTGAVDFNAAVTFLNNSGLTDLEPQQKADIVARLLEQTLKANASLPSWIKKQTLPDECKEIFQNLDMASFHLLPPKLQNYAFENNCQPRTTDTPAV